MVSKESRLKRRRKNADYGCALASATFFITSSILRDLNSKGILSDQEIADALNRALRILHGFNVHDTYDETMIVIAEHMVMGAMRGDIPAAP